MTMSNKKQEQVLVVDEHNERLKLLRYDSDHIADLEKDLQKLARNHPTTKVIIYAKKADIPVWTQYGYEQEGVIEGFDQGRNAHMLSRFLTAERAASAAPELAEQILEISLSKKQQKPLEKLPDEYQLRTATREDAEELAKLYGLVFATYPTPMDQPDYIRKTMDEDTYYLVIESAGSIVCAASAEVSPAFGSAELTDCATHPEHLGKSLLLHLFTALEQKMEEMGVYYLYTLTRAQSHGMNITAAKQGFEYRGRLVNNCKIFSGYEDMNIWVKPLRPTHD